MTVDDLQSWLMERNAASPVLDDLKRFSLGTAVRFDPPTIGPDDIVTSGSATMEDGVVTVRMT